MDNTTHQHAPIAPPGVTLTEHSAEQAAGILADIDLEQLHALAEVGVDPAGIQAELIRRHLLDRLGRHTLAALLDNLGAGALRQLLAASPVTVPTLAAAAEMLGATVDRLAADALDQQAHG